MNLKVLLNQTKDKIKKYKNLIFNTTIFANALSSLIKNICEFIKFWHK